MEFFGWRLYFNNKFLEIRIIRFECFGIGNFYFGGGEVFWVRNGDTGYILNIIELIGWNLGFFIFYLVSVVFIKKINWEGVKKVLG